MWEEHGWMFDFVSGDDLRRRRAMTQSRHHSEALRSANGERNDVWRRAGGMWSPEDPGLADEMAHAEAAWSEAFAKTIYAPISAYRGSGWVGPPDVFAECEPFAVLYLEWEQNYPDEWSREAGRWGSRYGWKERILTAMHHQGVGDSHREAVERLVLAAVRGPYRAKDWRYARIARQLDSPGLRESLRSIAAGDDEGARLRAEFVLSRLDQPGLSANRRSYDNWLQQRGKPCAPRPEARPSSRRSPSRATGVPSTASGALLSDQTPEQTLSAYPCAASCEVWYPSTDERDLGAFELAWAWTHEQLQLVGGQILVYTYWPAMLLDYPTIAHRRSIRTVRLATHKTDRGLLGWAGGPVLSLHAGEQGLAAVASNPLTRALCVVFTDTPTGQRTVHAWRTATQPTPLNDLPPA
jgi:hypothetical protein